MILVVDDEAAVRDAVSRSLRFEGFPVTVAADSQQALDTIAERRPDLVILDVLMPKLSGVAACRALRARGDSVPVLMLTAADAVGDRVAGLDAGADDYLVKPFALEELLARVRALLRRCPAGGEPVLRYGDLSLDPASREVRRGERALRLTRTEFAILQAFLRHPKQVLTRAGLFRQVWGYDPDTASNGVDVYVGYLRRKLEAGGEPRLLHTVRGVGYVLRDEPP